LTSGGKVDTREEVVDTLANPSWSWLDRLWRKGLASTIAVPRKKAPVANHTIVSVVAAALATTSPTIAAPRHSQVR